MEVRLVIPYNPLEEVGGLEISTVRFAVELKKVGISTQIVTKGVSGTINGISVVGFPTFTRLCQYLITTADDYDVLHWLEIFPDKGEVETQGMTSGLIKKLGKTVIFMVATSGNLTNRGSGVLVTPLLKEVANHYIVSNPAQIEEFGRFGFHRNIHNIGFGIDTANEFYPVAAEEKAMIRERLGLPIDKVLCFFIGRFVERKRPDFLLESWLELEDIYTQAQFIVVGSGMNQDDSIEDKVLSLAKVCRNIDFRDVTPHAHLYYKACDILLLPSSREGQPNVLMEAMACGNAVIGSDIPGIQELLIDGMTGKTFPVNGKEEFKTAIRQLVQSAELRESLGCQARLAISEARSIKVVTQQYVDLYTRR